MLPLCPVWLTRFVDALLRGSVSVQVRRAITYMVLLALGLLLVAPLALVSYVIWAGPLW